MSEIVNVSEERDFNLQQTIGFHETQGRTVAQAVNRRPVITETRFNPRPAYVCILIIIIIIQFSSVLVY